MAIRFFFENIKPFPLARRKISSWLKTEINKHGKKPGDLNYIFCSDEYLLDINQTYLQHDYLTDIITFGEENEGRIQGDIFISRDRIEENASTFKEEIERETLRMIIHGTLHLLGFQDKKPADKIKMTQAEDCALEQYLLIVSRGT